MPDPPPELPDDQQPEDELPEDLDASAVRVRYSFPDIKRRRIAGVLYVVVAGLCLTAWFAGRSDSALVNGGMLGAAITLLVVGGYHLVTAWPLAIRDFDALVAAAGKVGFPVGHASAQLGWRGLLSRPTWRVLVYSSEEPPDQRALVLVDAVDGRVLSHFVEPNPEDWSSIGR